MHAITSAGFNQEQMAARLGICRRTVIRHEHEGTPPLTFVFSYAAVTGVPVEWLLGDGDQASAPHDVNQSVLFVLAA